MKYKEGCPLCKMEKITPWYYADDEWVICECITCRIPMIVYKYHKDVEEIPCGELEYILQEARSIFGNDITFRTEQRKITDHFHWHIILKDRSLEDYEELQY